MTTDAFKEYVKTCRALDTEEIHRFMDDMSNEARRITFRLNTAYHTQDEVRGLLSELFGYEVPESLRVFPPFYADFMLFPSVSQVAQETLRYQMESGIRYGSDHSEFFSDLLPPSTFLRITFLQDGDRCIRF